MLIMTRRCMTTQVLGHPIYQPILPYHSRETQSVLARMWHVAVVVVMALVGCRGIHPNAQPPANDQAIRINELWDAVHQCDARRVAKLIDDGVSPDVRSPEGTALQILGEDGLPADQGKTPLHFAVMAGCGPVAEVLIRHSADLNARDLDGWTPLHFAAKKDIGITRTLVESGCQIDVRTTNRTPEAEAGSTPLHIAAYHGRLAVVRYLVQKGADVNALTANGHTALDCAERSEEAMRAEVVSELIKLGARPSTQEGPGFSSERRGHIFKN